MKKGMGGGGDMTLESRHLVGLFLGVVVLCGVFFTLGYVMGRAPQGANVMAAEVKGLPAPASGALDAATKPVDLAKPGDAKPAVPAPSEWHFPTAAEPAKPAAKLEAPKPVVKLNEAPAATAGGASRAAAPAPVTKAGAPAPKPSLFNPPRIAKGSLVLQVAALTRESDALLLADALQRKNFPAFVAMPAGDNLYRVQVGPYSDSESADLAKKGLQREGFKAIVKR